MRLPAAWLILFGHPGALRRLIGIVAGVAVAVGMLSILVGTFTHLPERESRSAWTTPSVPWEQIGQPLPDPQPDLMLHASHNDFVGDQVATVVSLGLTPDIRVTLPHGLAPLRPGEYYATGAMLRLIEELPDDQARDRYGILRGPLPDAMLSGPEQHAVLVGRTWEDVASLGVTPAIERELPTSGGRGEDAVYRIVIAIGMVALMVPITLLVGIVSQLGAAQRRERFATVRLIGAGRKTMARMSALEMGAASLVGSVVGVGLGWLLVPAATRIEIMGTPSFPADLMASPLQWLIMIVAVTVVGAGSAWWRTFRDDVGSLGAVRERPEKRVSAWRLVPVILGLASFVAATLSLRSNAIPVELSQLLLVGGFAIVAFGIVFAGPFLGRLGALALFRVAGRPASLVAAGRLVRHPRATFRSVSGLVVAVFLVTLFAGTVSIEDHDLQVADAPEFVPSHTLVAFLAEGGDPQAVMDAVFDVDGVQAVVPVITQVEADSRLVISAVDARALGFAPPVESGYVVIDGDAIERSGTEPDLVDPMEAVQGDVEGPVVVILVLTEGSDDAVNRARTALGQTHELARPALTRGEFTTQRATRMVNEMAVMGYVGMAIAVIISAVALTVATVAAALDRRRTFGLLRLSGMRVGELRKMLVLEASVPMLVTLVVSVGLGFLVAALLIEALTPDEYSMQVPDARYWVALIASVALGAVAVVSSFGMVRRSTEITSTRFE